MFIFRRRDNLSKRLSEIYNFEIKFRRRGILWECLGQIKELQIKEIIVIIIMKQLSVIIKLLQFNAVFNYSNVKNMS